MRAEPAPSTSPTEHSRCRQQPTQIDRNPVSVTRRSGLVPEVSTMRQKWPRSLRKLYPEARPRSTRRFTGQLTLLPTIQERATSRKYAVSAVRRQVRAISPLTRTKAVEPADHGVADQDREEPLGSSTRHEAAAEPAWGGSLHGLGSRRAGARRPRERGRASRQDRAGLADHPHPGSQPTLRSCSPSPRASRGAGRKLRESWEIGARNGWRGERCLHDRAAESKSIAHRAIVRITSVT